MSEATATLSVVVVTYNSRPALADTLPALLAQLEPGDELVVVDNASADDTLEAAEAMAPQATLVAHERNQGFAAGCNAGAQRASGDLLVFLNPDAVPQPGFSEAIRRPLVERLGWAAWMGLVTMGDGRVVNTAGGVVHFTGIAWAGQSGLPAAEAGRSIREVAFASGACLAVPRDRWHRVGGFSPEFFMYCEDVDLSLRLRLLGERVGIVPEARVDHAYAFARGPAKWRLLERNRWATLLRTYPGPLLALVAPALLAAELAVIAASLRGGWGREKLRASLETIGALPRLLGERRGIQRGRKVRTREFASWLTAELSSPYLGRVTTSTSLRRALRAYWTVVRVLVGGGR